MAFFYPKNPIIFAFDGFIPVQTCPWKMLQGDKVIAHLNTHLLSFSLSLSLYKYF